MLDIRFKQIFDVWNSYHDLHLAAKTKSDLANNSDVFNLLREMEIRPHRDGKIGEVLSQVFRTVDIRVK
jgi:hypothetical protein